VTTLNNAVAIQEDQPKAARLPIHKLALSAGQFPFPKACLARTLIIGAQKVQSNQI
jgi:hypothetical protein